MTSLNYNPYVPCIKLRLGSHYIEYSRENLVSLSLTRKMGQPLNIKLSLYDDSAIVLESLLLKNKDDIAFQYGYEGGLMSPVYKCTLQSYSPEFSAGGVLIDVTLTPPTAEQTGVKTATYTGKISDIVKQIANEEGWDIGEIETTSTSGTYSRNNLTPVAFIKQELIPVAVSQTSGKSGYLFQMDSNSSKPRVSFTTADTGFTPTRTYEVVIGRDSETVISFTPSYTVYPTEYIANVVDPTTNEIFSVKVTGDPGEFAKVTRPIANSSYQVGDLVSIAKSMYATNSAMYKKGTLVIKGDPTIESMNTISIVVLSKDGIPHSVSGNYIIMNVEDEIEEGSFTTTLELATSLEDPSVQTDKVEETRVDTNVYNSIDSTVGKSGTTTANLNMRTGAGTYYNIILTIPKGSTVNILSGPDPNNWYCVKYNGKEGWCSGDYLTVGIASPGTPQGPINISVGGGSNPIGKTIKNSQGDWVCPTKGTITAGYPSYPGGGSHNGLDISDRSCPPVYAARAGTVSLVNFYERRHTSFVSGLGVNAFGTCVYIDHGGGVTSIYGHMQAGSLKVKVGQTVAAGQQLGIQGNTGIAMGATGIHLHFEVRVNGKAVNPCTNYSVGNVL